MNTMTKSAAALLSGALTLAASLHTLHGGYGGATHVPQNGTPSACEAWKEELAKLTPSQKDALRKDGAVMRPGYLLLGEDLVPDCELRGRMSSYFNEVLSVLKDRDDNRKFAAAHSKEIVAVLRRIWPTLGDSEVLTGDGLGETKYVLLADPALAESDIAPLVSDILDAETIDNGLGRIIFHRPLPGVKPALLRIMNDLDDPATSIMILTILNKMGEPSALPELKRLARDPSLSAVERRYAAAIAAKAARGEEIKFSDVERLEYEDAGPAAGSMKVTVTPPAPK